MEATSKHRIRIQDVEFAGMSRATFGGRVKAHLQFNSKA